MGRYRLGIECATAALSSSSSSAPLTRWRASQKNDDDDDTEGGDADNNDVTLIVSSSPPHDNNEDDNVTENCGVSQIDDAGCGGARATAEAGGGPGLVRFCWKLLRAAQEEPSRTAAAAAKEVAADAVAAAAVAAGQGKTDKTLRCPESLGAVSGIGHCNGGVASQRVGNPLSPPLIGLHDGAAHGDHGGGG